MAGSRSPEINPRSCGVEGSSGKTVAFASLRVFLAGGGFGCLEESWSMA